MPSIEKALAKWLPASTHVSVAASKTPDLSASANASSPSVLDQEIITRWKALAAKTDPALLVEIFSSFLDDTPRQIEKLRDAFAQNRTDQLRREAHTLHGASLNLGAHDLAAVCRRLETEPLDHAAQLPAALFAEFERVRPELERELSNARTLSPRTAIEPLTV